MKKLFYLLFIGLIASGAFFAWSLFNYHGAVKDAQALCIGTKWSNWQYKEDLTKCEPVAECGTTKGTKTVKEKRECEWTCGGGFACQLGDKQYREVEVGCEVEYVECEPEVTPTPTPTETPEPTPTEKPVVRENPITPAGAPVCVGEEVAVAPYYAGDYMSRVDADTIRVTWNLNDPHAQSYGIYYGLSEDNLPYYTEVFGHETTSTEINGDLPGHVWVKICSVGACGDQVCGLTVDP